MALAPQLKLEPNKEELIALKYRTGKIVQGHFGQSMMYTLSDNRVMFLELGRRPQDRDDEPATE